MHTQMHCVLCDCIIYQHIVQPHPAKAIEPASYLPAMPCHAMVCRSVTRQVRSSRGVLHGRRHGRSVGGTLRVGGPVAQGAAGTQAPVSARRLEVLRDNLGGAAAALAVEDGDGLVGQRVAVVGRDSRVSPGLDVGLQTARIRIHACRYAVQGPISHPTHAARGRQVFRNI